MLLPWFGSRVTCGLRKTNHGISGGMSRTKQNAGAAGVCDTIVEPWEKCLLYMERTLGSEGERIRGVRGISQKRRLWGGYDLSHWEGKNRHDIEQQEEYHLNIYIYVYTRRTKLIGGDTSLHFGQKGKQAWNHNGNITYKKDCGGITFLE